jgi:glycerol-3-phosphate dehydrogenase
MSVYDILVIGGGINGTGLARDAAGRGLSVLLCEQGDLAEFTSSASTKLIHGGIRYLENWQFRLVREALVERERLLALAPHIIGPLQFVLPYHPRMRPAWTIRLGLFLYDHLTRARTLPSSRSVRLTTSPWGGPLQPQFSRGFVFSDGWVDDSRLVVLNAMHARDLGAKVLTRTRLLEARAQAGQWRATLQDTETARIATARARAIVNAAGPWVTEVSQRRLGLAGRPDVRLVKGSHIVVPRFYEGEHAYILQNPDRRVIFAIPYEKTFTLVGTTEVPYHGAPGPVAIDHAETAYLCESINRYFVDQISPQDVVFSYSGIRPLYAAAAVPATAVSRDYVLELNTAGGAPALIVYGGKITTYRRLAEHVLQKLEPFFPGLKPAWTASSVLPGGDLPGGRLDLLVNAILSRYPFLPRLLVERLARAYGTRVDVLLDGAARIEDLGRDCGGGLTQAEVSYLVRYEWARTVKDVLWRRSKLGLHVSPATAAALQACLNTARSAGVGSR